MPQQDPDLTMDEDQGPAPNPPRQTQVNVILNSFNPGTGKANFDLQPAGADPLQPPNGPDKTLTFNNQGHDGLDVAFVLTDNTGGNYVFPPNNLKGNAISSQLGQTNYCPPQGTNDVFSVKSVSPDGLTLTVHNANQDLRPKGGRDLLGPFGYVLWVTNDGGKTYKPLDPGGNNMNGPTS